MKSDELRENLDKKKKRIEDTLEALDLLDTLIGYFDLDKNKFNNEKVASDSDFFNKDFKYTHLQVGNKIRRYLERTF